MATMIAIKVFFRRFHKVVKGKRAVSLKTIHPTPRAFCCTTNSLRMNRNVLQKTTWRRATRKYSYSSTSQKTNKHRKKNPFAMQSLIGLSGLTVSMTLSYNCQNETKCASIGAATGLLTAQEAWNRAKLRCQNYDFRKLFQTLIEMDDTIDMNSFQEILHELDIIDDDIITSIFDVVDANHDGILQLSEIQAILTLLQSGTLKERELFLFDCLDLDKNGVIDTKEFEEFLISLFIIQHNINCDTPFQRMRYAIKLRIKYGNVDKMTLFTRQAKDTVKDIFQSADSNKDGVINKTEWLEWCQSKSSYVIKLHNLLIDTIHVEI